MLFERHWFVRLLCGRTMCRACRQAVFERIAKLKEGLRVERRSVRLFRGLMGAERVDGLPCDKPDPKREWIFTLNEPEAQTHPRSCGLERGADGELHRRYTWISAYGCLLNGLCHLSYPKDEWSEDEAHANYEAYVRHLRTTVR